jgi:hypothetical protein
VLGQSSVWGLRGSLALAVTVGKATFNAHVKPIKPIKPRPPRALIRMRAYARTLALVALGEPRCPGTECPGGATHPLQAPQPIVGRCGGAGRAIPLGLPRRLALEPNRGAAALLLTTPPGRAFAVRDEAIP